MTWFHGSVITSDIMILTFTFLFVEARFIIFDPNINTSSLI